MPKYLTLFLLLAIVFISPIHASNSNKLNPARLKICQAREATLKNRSDKIINMSTAMLNNFEIKSQKVQDYYSQNLVHKGITVANYGNLITDVQIKKTAVQVSLSKARAEASVFSCTGTEPQKSLRDFKIYIQETNTALKNYRTSVNNLIVAVRTAANSAKKS